MDDSPFVPGTSLVTLAAGTYRTVRDTVDDNDAGALAMTQRRALLAAIETPLGDTAMDDVNDALRVNVVAGSSGGVTHTDDAPFTVGVDDGVPAMALFGDAAPDLVNDGDAGAVRMSANRVLYTQVRDAAGNERGATVTAGNRLSVDGSGVTQPVSDAAGSLTVDAPVGTPLNVQVGDGTRTATVRDTGASDSLNVAIVDAAGNQITSFGGGTQYAEDAPSVGGEQMTLAGAVRADVPGTTTTLDGDYANLKTDSVGRLWVNGSGVTQPVSGTVTAAAQPGVDIGDVTVNNGAGAAAVNVQDGGNSLTVDAPVGTPVATRLSDGAAFLTTVGGRLSVDASGVAVPVTDNAASLTVDAPAAAPVAVQPSDGAALQTFAALDLDTGIGTVTRIAVGIAGADSGGPKAIPGNDVDGLLVNLGANNDVTIQANASVNIAQVGGNAVAAGAGAVTAGTLRVTVATDDVVSVDDAGASITVDAPVATPVATRTSDGAAFYELPARHAMNGAFTGSAAIGGQLDDAATVVATEDNVAPARITAQRALHANLRNVAGTEIGTAGAPVRTDPTGTTTQPVSDAAGSLTVDAPVGTPVATRLSDGAAFLTTTGGRLSVDGSGVTQPVSGTVTAAQATAANLNAQVVGDLANDAIDAGNPVKVGAQAVNVGATPAAVAAADRVNLLATRYGQLFTLGGHMNVTRREYRATTAQTNDPISDTIAAGSRIVITEIAVVADNANGANVGVRIGFGAATLPAEPADGAFVDGMVLAHPGIAAGSGVVHGSGSGILAIGGDGEELRITTSAAQAVKVLVTYFVFAA